MHQLILLAILALSGSAKAQNFYGSQQTSSSCQCPQQYIPFCATDGSRETTYTNKCQLQCAQRSNPRLRIKFEGVCAKPYEPTSESKGGRQLNGKYTSSSQQRPSYQSSSSQQRPTYPTSSGQQRPSYQSSSSQQRPSYQSSTSQQRPSYQSSSSQQRPSYQSSSSQQRPSYQLSSSQQRPSYPTGQYTIGSFEQRPSSQSSYGGSSYGRRGSRQSYNDLEFDNYD